MSPNRQMLMMFVFILLVIVAVLSLVVLVLNYAPCGMFSASDVPLRCVSGR